MTRTEIINLLISANGFKSYLELGIYDAERNYDKINVKNKTGVDVRNLRKDIIESTTDDFFAKNKTTKYDLIFVDADHRYEAVKSDVKNALSRLNAGGVVIMHDCNPATAEAAAPEKPYPTASWNGEAYRVMSELRMRKKLKCITVDTDHGIGIVQKLANDNPNERAPSSYAEFDAQREYFLGLISVDQFMSQIDSI